MFKTAIIDYGAGNLRNVYTALNELDFNPVISKSKQDLDDASLLILPGVGAFPKAMDNLQKRGLDEVIKTNVKKGKPMLGICLGMQMLFDKSSEIQETKGLELIPGQVVPFIKEELREGSKIPHMGWNELVVNHPEDPFLKDIRNGDYVYFVHSYYADPKNFDKNVLAWSDYTVRVPAIVRNGNVIGTQFHPEKSSKVGFKLLENLKREFLK